MQQDATAEVPPAETRIRELGFDPSHLTPLEQQELVEIHSACPDDALEPRRAVDAWMR